MINHTMRGKRVRLFDIEASLLSNKFVSLHK
jgi:hypothetical protein